jgi:starch synthase
MQAALGSAARVTTVSPTYAAEIQRPEFGYGLDGTFRHVGAKLVGILNGLDVAAWDPARDPHLPRPYDAEHPRGKRAAKGALCGRFGLDSSRPLLGVVSRLADQKGIDLVLAAGDGLVAQGWSLALLGSGEEALERAAEQLAARHPGAVGAHLGFDEALAHLVYAGADALAVPSRFEPCGLSQMIAMRYGTLPIARDTGGLHDTIRDGDTGFLFEHASAAGLLRAAGRAREAFEGNGWPRMMAEAMRGDFAWSGPARRYEELYRAVVALPR